MKIREFHRFILPEVIGCPEPTIDQAVLLAAYEFCDQSGIWEEFQDPQTIQAGIQDYDIERPSEGVMLRVREVWVDNRLLSFAPTRDVDHWSKNGGNPIHYNAAVDRSQIRLFPTPSVTGGQLKVRAVYAPAMNATNLPDFLFHRHVDGIASGAKARLMLMSGAEVTWSNPQMGAVYASRFGQMIVNARIESQHEHVEGSLRAQPRSFHLMR